MAYVSLAMGPRGTGFVVAGVDSVYVGFVNAICVLRFEGKLGLWFLRRTSRATSTTAINMHTPIGTAIAAARVVWLELGAGDGGGANDDDENDLD